MRDRIIRSGILLILVMMTIVLVGCSDSLPKAAKKAVFGGFEPDEKPTIDSALKVEPLPKDVEAGATEVWCVNLTFTCWSCSHGEYRTCADSRLVRRINGKWEVTVVFTEKDKADWQARGCKLMPDQVSGYGS